MARVIVEVQPDPLGVKTPVMARDADWVNTGPICYFCVAYTENEDWPDGYSGLPWKTGEIVPVLAGEQLVVRGITRLEGHEKGIA